MSKNDLTDVNAPELVSKLRYLREEKDTFKGTGSIEVVKKAYGWVDWLMERANEHIHTAQRSSLNT